MNRQNLIEFPNTGTTNLILDSLKNYPFNQCLEVLNIFLLIMILDSEYYMLLNVYH